MLASQLVLLALATNPAPTPVPQGLKEEADTVITLAFKGTSITDFGTGVVVRGSEDVTDDATRAAQGAGDDWVEEDHVDLFWEISQIVEYSKTNGSHSLGWGDRTFGYDVTNVVQQDVAHHYEKRHAWSNGSWWEGENNGKPWLTVDVRVWFRHTDATLQEGRDAGKTYVNGKAEALWDEAKDHKSGLRGKVSKLLGADVNCNFKRDWYYPEVDQEKGKNPLKSGTHKSTHFARQHCSVRDDFDGHGNRYGLGFGLGFVLVVFGGLLGVMFSGGGAKAAAPAPAEE